MGQISMQILKEHDHQKAVFTWAMANREQWPELNLLYAIPNEDKRSVERVRKLKAQGMRPGLPDLCLPTPRGDFHGLYIELKRPGGKLRPNQELWLKALAGQGYMTAVCIGADEAITTIKDYLDDL